MHAPRAPPVEVVPYAGLINNRTLAHSLTTVYLLLRQHMPELLKAAIRTSYHMYSRGGYDHDSHMREVGT